VQKGQQEMVAAAFRTVFAYSSQEEISAQYDKVAAMLAERFERASVLMAEAKEEILAFSSFPRAHWRQIWSTTLERLNKELKRRCRVVGIFPNEASVTRLAGAVLLDIHDEWQLPIVATSPKSLWPSSPASATMSSRKSPSSSPRTDRH
jgi:putative transposase